MNTLISHNVRFRPPLLERIAWLIGGLAVTLAAGSAAYALCFIILDFPHEAFANALECKVTLKSGPLCQSDSANMSYWFATAASWILTGYAVVMIAILVLDRYASVHTYSVARERYLTWTGIGATTIGVTAACLVGGPI